MGSRPHARPQHHADVGASANDEEFRMKLMRAAAAALVAAIPLTLLTTSVRGSSHAEAPAITLDPSVDNTDVWSWKNEADKIVVLAAVNPLRVPQAGPNYDLLSPDALYEIHIDTTGDGVEDLTYQFQFKTIFKEGNTFLRVSSPPAYPALKSADDPAQNYRQTYSVTRVNGPRRSGTFTAVGQDFPMAPPNTGPKFTPNYESIAASTTLSTSAVRTTTDGCRVFVGPRQEAFFIDLGAVFDRLTIRDFDARGNVGNKGGGVNALSGFNVDVIALEIPIANLGVANPSAAGTAVGVWSSVSRRKVTILRADGQDKITEGRWVQVSRLGNPLMNELFIPAELKDSYNASEPRDDVDSSGKANPNGKFTKFFLDPEPARLLNAIYKIEVPPAPRVDLAVLLPDTLKVRLDIAPLKPTDPAFFGNPVGPLLGRTLADDVVDIYLRAAAGILTEKFNRAPNNQLGDGVDFATSAVRPLSSFPYMGTAYSGVDGFPPGRTEPDSGYPAGRNNTFLRATPPR
jgi:hypothetical protein